MTPKIPSTLLLNGMICALIISMTVLKGVGIDWTYLGKTMHTLDLSENRLSSIGVSYVGSAGNSIGKLIDTTFLQCRC